jgi:hypothetical protein
MLTGCCQQAFSIRGQHFNRRGFPMMFSRSFAVHAGFGPLGRVQSWALEHVVAATLPSGDLRLTLAALALRALAALEALVERQLVRFARNTMGRALQGARFAGSLRTADSMVAAGGR